MLLNIVALCRNGKRYHCMIKCHLSKHKPIYIIVLPFRLQHWAFLFFSLPWINIWETSDGVWQKCHFNSQFHIKYEPNFYTLISVYWFCSPRPTPSSMFPLRSKRWAFFPTRQAIHFPFSTYYFTSATFFFSFGYLNRKGRIGKDWWKCENNIDSNDITPREDRWDDRLR